MIACNPALMVQIAKSAGRFCVTQNVQATIGHYLLVVVLIVHLRNGAFGLIVLRARRLQRQEIILHSDT